LENSFCKSAAVIINHKALTAMTRVSESDCLEIYQRNTLNY
jgi:hypothetical protein